MNSKVAEHGPGDPEMDLCVLMFDVEMFVKGITPGVALGIFLNVLFYLPRAFLNCPLAYAA